MKLFSANGAVLEVGHVVGLICGGPPMAIEYIDGTEEAHVGTLWYDVNGVLQCASFAPELLIKLCPGCLHEHDEDEEHEGGPSGPPKDNRAS